MAARRLAKELEDLKKDPPANCSAGPVEDNIFNWKAQMYGVRLKRVCSKIASTPPKA